MKQTILLALTLFTTTLFAQDTIIKFSGDTIVASIKEINVNHIFFSYYNKPDAQVQSMNKNSVSLIIHQNGEKEFFAKTKSSKTDIAPDSGLTKQDSAKYKRMARIDASKNNKYTGLKIAVGVFSMIFSPAIAYIPVTLILKKPLSEKELHSSNPELFKLKFYREAYIKKVCMKKRFSVYAALSVGAMINWEILNAINNKNNFIDNPIYIGTE